MQTPQDGRPDFVIDQKMRGLIDHIRRDLVDRDLKTLYRGLKTLQQPDATSRENKMNTYFANTIPVTIPNECMHPKCHSEVKGSQAFRVDADPNIYHLVFTCIPCGESLARRMVAISHGGIALTKQTIDEVNAWGEIYAEGEAKNGL